MVVKTRVIFPECLISQCFGHCRCSADKSLSERGIDKDLSMFSCFKDNRVISDSSDTKQTYVASFQGYIDYVDKGNFSNYCICISFKDKIK